MVGRVLATYAAPEDTLGGRLTSSLGCSNFTNKIGRFLVLHKCVDTRSTNHSTTSTEHRCIRGATNGVIEKILCQNTDKVCQFTLRFAWTEVPVCEKCVDD